MTPISFKSTHRQSVMRRIIAAIQSKPKGMSRGELMAYLGISETSVKDYTKALYGAGILKRKLHKEDRQHPENLYTVAAAPEVIASYLSSSQVLRPRLRAESAEREAMPPVLPVPYADLPREFFGRVAA